MLKQLAEFAVSEGIAVELGGVWPDYRHPRNEERRSTYCGGSQGWRDEDEGNVRRYGWHEDGQQIRSHASKIEGPRGSLVPREGTVSRAE